MLNHARIRKGVIVTLCVLIVLTLLNNIYSSIKGNNIFSSNSDNNSNKNQGNKKSKGASDLFGLGRNEKDEILQQLDKLSNILVEQQEKRLIQLERDNDNLEKQIKELKKPSPNSSLRERLAYVYPYDLNEKFPAYIWQTWKYGLNDDRFGIDYKKGEEQWAILNPKFIHDIFNDDTANAIIRHLYVNLPEVIKAYESLPHLLLKIDFFKYLILFAKGGVYADIDTVPIQPVPNWIPENVDSNEIGMIIGIESDPKVGLNWKKYYARRLQFSNWVIQAKPGHPILREVIATITEITLTNMKPGTFKMPRETEMEFLTEVMNWTGDGTWTDVIFRYFNDYVLSGIFSKVTWKDFTKMEVPKLVSDVLVLPAFSFNAVESEQEKTVEQVHLKNNFPPNHVIEDDTHPLAFVRHFRDSLFMSKDTVLQDEIKN